MKIGERVRDMIRHWLQIQPATGQNITIRETASFNGIPFVPQKLRNFPAILEHRKIQTNPL